MKESLSFDQHNDAEMQWILQEVLSNLFKNKQAVKRGHLAESIGRAIFGVITERVPKIGLTRYELEQTALDFLTNMPEKQNHTAQDTIFYLANNLLAYCSLRSLGLKSRFEEKAAQEYWPFGQDGGFCNPIKLKILED